MPDLWKTNWPETRQHFLDWWERRGLVLGMWGFPQAEIPHASLSRPQKSSVRDVYTDNDFRIKLNEHDLAQGDFPADCLPLASSNMGPGSLCLYLGCEPEFTRETVWFHPAMQHVDSLGSLEPLRFDPENRWWKLTESLLRAQSEHARGRYFCSSPDLAANLDILAALREPQTLMIDMIQDPESVKLRLAEINQVFFDVYQRIYDMIKLPDGSSCYEAFYLWGPGKTALVQCDAAAMISPDMFAEFVVPPLDEQCSWLDHSMFHLDGTQCLDKLEYLLDIESLDAIEWTPQAGIEQGGDPRWYPLYRRILEAGKSVQVVGVEPDEILPLLDAIGGKGVYIITGFRDCKEAEFVLEKIEPYRQS